MIVLFWFLVEIRYYYCYVAFWPANLILSMCCWFSMHSQALWHLLVQFDCPILIIVLNSILCSSAAFSPSNLIAPMRCWVSLHSQSPFLLLVQFDCPILKSGENQAHWVLCCWFLTLKFNCFSVLLIFNPFPISIPPSAPILLSYVDS